MKPIAAAERTSLSEAQQIASLPGLSQLERKAVIRTVDFAGVHLIAEGLGSVVTGWAAHRIVQIARETGTEATESFANTVVQQAAAIGLGKFFARRAAAWKAHWDQLKATRFGKLPAASSLSAARDSFYEQARQLAADLSPPPDAGTALQTRDAELLRQERLLLSEHTALPRDADNNAQGGAQLHDAHAPTSTSSTHPQRSRETPGDGDRPKPHSADEIAQAAVHPTVGELPSNAQLRLVGQGRQPRVIRKGERILLEVPSGLSPAETGRVVAGLLAEDHVRQSRREFGLKTEEETSALGANGDGRQLSSKDHGMIAELRTAREQLARGDLDAAETRKAEHRVRQVEEQMGIADDSPSALQRRQAVDAHMEIQADRARRDAAASALGGERGHTGIEVHSHFMGIVDADVFRQRAATANGGKDTGSWMPLLEQLSALPALERAVRAKKQAGHDGAPGKSAMDPLQFSHDAEGTWGKGESAMKVVADAGGWIEALHKRMERAKPADRATYQRAIEGIAEEASRKALSSTPETPFDGAYAVRDALVRTTFGTDERGKNPQAAFDDYIRETVLQLARDQVSYSEQSTGLSKLAKETSINRIETVIDQLVSEGRLAPGQVEIKMLGMIKTAHFGEPHDRLAPKGRPQTSRDKHDAEASKALELARRDGVIGIDVGGPEYQLFNAEGQQRFKDDYVAALADATKSGRPFVFRPHVGEGAVDNVRSDDYHTDKNRHVVGDEPSHYPRSRENLEALLDAISALRQQGIYDPTKVIVRFGHATHATPEQAARMRDLGVIAEVNLGSNVATGSVSQTEGVHGPRTVHEKLDDHSLPSLLFYDTNIILSTDGGAVMNTTLRDEYARARRVIESVLDGTQPIRVRAEDARLGGKERGRASSHGEHVRELWISDLTPAERARFLRGYEKLFRDAQVYYRRRPQPGRRSEHAPLEGAHHADVAVEAGLHSPTGGTAAYVGDAAAVRAAADRYEASGYEVRRSEGAPIVVTWYEQSPGDASNRQPAFTTVLSVAPNQSAARSEK